MQNYDILNTLHLTCLFSNLCPTLSNFHRLFLFSWFFCHVLDLLLFASSQSITWFARAAWSEIADLVCSCLESFLSARVNFLDSTFLVSDLCSESLTQVWEAMEIRKRGAKVFNREEGTYLLSYVYDPLLSRTLTPEVKRQQVPRKSGSSTILKKSSDV